MKKFISKLLVLFSFLSFANYNQAQVVLKLSNATGNQGDTVSVDVTVDGFTNMEGAQFSIVYDSAIVSYIDIPGASRKPEFSPLSVSDHRAQGTAVKNGQLGFTWNNDSGGSTTLPNGTKLFSIRFKLIGKQCDSTFISYVTKSTPPLPPIEFSSTTGIVDVDATSKGKVKILGPGCLGGGGGTGGGTEVTLSAETATVNQGATYCVKISVKNFKDIESMQSSISWNKSILRYKSITITSALADLVPGNFTLKSDSSALGFLWSPSNGNAVTLADNTVIFEICFEAIGPVGSMSTLTFGDSPVITEITDKSGVVTPKFENGKLTIANAGEKMTLYYMDTMVTEKTKICIPIKVDNFSCMESFQFAVKFDTSVLKFDKANSLNLPNLGTGNFFATHDTLRITWDMGSNGPQTLANGSVIFSLCFDHVPVTPCPGPVTTKLQFINLPSGPIEFTNCRGTLTTMLMEGTITIKCGSAALDCKVVGTDETCYNACDGKLDATITGGSGNFRFQWNKVSPPMNNIANTQNLTNQCAGSYRLIITDLTTNQNVVCPTTEIKGPTEIVISPIISHVTNASNNDGKIDITVTGGTPGYTYKWFRLPNTSAGTTEDISNLRCGKYRVSVTDTKGCVKIDTFEVDCFYIPPTCTINKNDSIRCNGDCTGILQANIAGGTIPYRYKWSRGANDTLIRLTNVCAGNYTLTVSDVLGNTSTCAITLTEPPKLTLTVTNIISGPAGGATASGGGGTPPYTYVWTDSAGTVISTNPVLTGAAAGKYTVCVKDKNDCQECQMVTIPKGGGGNTLTFTMVLDAGVSCKGKCDAKIIVNVSQGTSPFTYKWSHDANLNSNIASNLCAGTYTVTVTDAANNSKTSSLSISDVSNLRVSLRKEQCATDNVLSDGRYSATASGGTAPYSYAWCSGASTQVASDLKSGDCSITVTDNNGCTLVETFTVCEGTSSPFDCYQGRKAISPNGDGYNDILEINCVTNADNILYIYDRWGNLVFGQTNYDNSWEGLDDSGEPLKEGTYMWVLRVREVGRNDEYYKGTVTIVR